MTHHRLSRILRATLAPALVILVVLCSGLLISSGTVPRARVAPSAPYLWQLPGHPRPRAPDQANGLPLPCQNPTAMPRCYTPAQIALGYDVTPLLVAGIDGRGQSIVIMSGSPDPSLSSDLHAFDQAFGLPDASVSTTYLTCTLSGWTCQVSSPGPANPAVTVETSIDAEWSHAIAPRAHLVVVTVDTSQATTAEQTLEYLVAGARYAIDQRLGEIVSLSESFGEPCSSSAFVSFEHATFQEAQQQHITVTVSSGDEGSTQYTCDVSSFFSTPTVATPASDPLVLATGGTTLTLSSEGLYQSEAAWTQVSAQQNNGAGGGGYSSLDARPDYQDGLNANSARGLPDVSFDADPNTGYIVTCSFCNNGVRVWFNTGGTSFAAPAWAGLIALADQMAGHSLGFVNPTLYTLFQHVPLAFHDLTSGNNSYAFVNGSGQVVTVPGYQAVPGWDAATGLGSPNAAVLLPSLSA